MFRLLEFVEHGHRIILHGDPALALGIDQKLVAAQAEFSCPCPGSSTAEGARKVHSSSCSFRSCSRALLVALEPGLIHSGKSGASITFTPDATSSPPAPPTQRTRLIPAFLAAAIIDEVPRTCSSYISGFTVPGVQPGLNALISASWPAMSDARESVS